MRYLKSVALAFILCLSFAVCAYGMNGNVPDHARGKGKDSTQVGPQGGINTDSGNQVQCSWDGKETINKKVWTNKYNYHATGYRKMWDYKTYARYHYITCSNGQIQIEKRTRLIDSGHRTKTRH